MDLAGNEQCVEVQSFRLESLYFHVFSVFFRTNGAVAEQQKHEMAPQGFLTSVLYLQALQQVAFIPTAGPSAEQASHSFQSFLVAEVNGEMRSPASLLDPRKEDCDNATA